MADIGGTGDKIKIIRPMQFAQKIVLIAFIFSLSVVLITLALNFILLWVEKQSMSQETITAITVYGGITSGLSFTAYAALQGWRNSSENKYCNGNHENGGNKNAG